MSITDNHLYAALALLLTMLAVTYQPDDTVAWQAGDGAKHYGGGHGG